MIQENLAFIDIAIIVTFFLISFGISLKYRSSSNKDLKSFFLGGGKLPWYLAGISMVATTFAADTPLAVTELVRGKGISGNWLWWNFLAGGLLTTFFFAKLWKRSGVITEAELIELRYSGKPARILRGFKAIYLGVFMNILIMAWVNVAMVSILVVFFDLAHFDAILYTILAMIFVSIYSAIGGLKGIIITDSVQFILAMIGSILLAYFVLDHEAVGGIEGIKTQLNDNQINFLPGIGKGEDGVFSFDILSIIVYMGMMWWASWYPGAEPGGGGYIAQRMMSTKDENHAFWATLFFQIGHYVLRPWPWILTALACLILYPNVTGDDIKLSYVFAIKDHLPIGVKGLLLTSFFAAYMSTISTQLNWGMSYIMNDLYARFIKPNESQKHYIHVNYIITFVLILMTGGVTFFVESISEVWKFLMSCGAGLGLVLILRWYWWRINAWSEISAMIAPGIATALIYIINFAYKTGQLRILSIFNIHPSLSNIEIPDLISFELGFIITVLFTTIVWFIVTISTSPTAKETLFDFIKKVKPQGRWNLESLPSKQITNDVLMEENYKPDNSKLSALFISWLISIIGVYSLLFGIGNIIFEVYDTAFIQIGITTVCFSILFYLNKKKKLFSI